MSTHTHTHTHTLTESDTIQFSNPTRKGCIKPRRAEARQEAVAQASRTRRASYCSYYYFPSPERRASHRIAPAWPGPNHVIVVSFPSRYCWCLWYSYCRCLCSGNDRHDYCPGHTICTNEDKTAATTSTTTTIIRANVGIAGGTVHTTVATAIECIWVGNSSICHNDVLFQPGKLAAVQHVRTLVRVSHERRDEQWQCIRRSVVNVTNSW
jgi:hypothetical protein